MHGKAVFSALLDWCGASQAGKHPAQAVAYWSEEWARLLAGECATRRNGWGLGRAISQQVILTANQTIGKLF
jgi:hypothetical protein